MKGVYILIIQLTSDVNINIGALGTRHFAKGLYTYVGSAQTNFQKRVSWHLRKKKPKFWHIDYLLDNHAAKIMKVLFKEAAKTAQDSANAEQQKVLTSIKDDLIKKREGTN